MAKMKVAIHVQKGGTRSDEQVITLGEAYVKRWKIPTHQQVTLRFGSAKRDVRIASVPHLAALRINETLAGKLGLHNKAQLCLQYKPGSRTVTVGPLIGVLVSRVFSQAADRPFGAMTAFCRELTDACEQYGGFVFFFTPNDIVSGSATVSGWCFNSKWSKRTFPLPDVVYNRLTSRKLENRPVVQHFLKDIKSRYGGTVFNEKYLNKTEVFRALQSVAELKEYLPESHGFKNFAMLKTMCNKYGTVFLKPVTGSLGNGIIKISRQPDAGYVCYFTSMSGMRKQSHPTLTRLFHTISGKMKQQRYQIQQGLRLIEVSGRPVDFRALVQRNGSGEWTITSIVARIAANNTFVSNLARGGTLNNVQGTVAKSNASPDKRAGANVRLRKAALQIAKGIETQIPAHFAELGIDLALDVNGKVWLIEVNSKPSKDDNAQKGSGKIRPSVKQLVSYSQHLAGL